MSDDDQHSGGSGPGAPPPLCGFKVLDLTRVLSGPFATLVLADLGAEIWKVEHPGGGDQTRRIEPTQRGQSHYFMSLNRNKASIAVDLKTPEGRQIVAALAQRADVVVENFRPGVAARLELDYERVASDNPGVVYCSISAFGQSGPLADQAAFDVALQAMSGLMHITGDPEGGPMRAGIPVADLGAGLGACIGILAALVDRGRTGQGRHVDMSMLDAMVSMLGYSADRYFMTGEEPARMGTGHPSVVPYGVFPAADGDLVLATLSEHYWQPLCVALGRPDLAGDPRLATNADRVAHRGEVDQAVADALSRHPVSYWQQVLSAADIPHAPVLTVGQALEHPQVAARAMVRRYRHPLLGDVPSVGPMVHMAGSAAPGPLPAPLLGQDTARILRRELGLSPERIDQLGASRVIACAVPDEHHGATGEPG